MKNLVNYITSKVAIANNDTLLIKELLNPTPIQANTLLLKEGQTEKYINFLSDGYVKGYQNIDGKIVIQHLIGPNDIFTSLDSFTNQTPSIEYYETITDCTLIRISKENHIKLCNNTNFWNSLTEKVTQEHLNCKMNRVKDFQMLTAKERYIKFMEENPKLALHFSVDNIASYLGMEPQSLSRIRKQLTF